MHINTYVGPHINNCLSINCNTFDIVMYISLFNIRLYNSLSVVVLIGRLMPRVMSIKRCHASNTRYTHKDNSLKQSLISASRLIQIKLRPPFILMNGHAGFHTNSDNSNSQQQPMVSATDKQTNCY